MLVRHTMKDVGLTIPLQSEIFSDFSPHFSIAARSVPESEMLFYLFPIGPACLS